MTAESYPTGFLSAIATVLSDEGGYRHDRDHRGGESNFGISRAEYPELDIKTQLARHRLWSARAMFAATVRPMLKLSILILRCR